MVTENLSTLKIHKLTQAQYERELEAGRIDENALYLTPDEEMDLSQYATIEQLNDKADADHIHDDLYYTETEIDDKLDTMQSDIDSKVDAVDGKGLSTNYYTDEEQQKLRDIESGANYYEHPAHSSHDLGLYKVTVDGEGHVSETSLVEKEDIIAFVEKDDILALGIPDKDVVDGDISDLNDRIDDVDGEISKINEILGDLSEEFEDYKTTNNNAVSTNTGDIESNKNAIKAIQDDYLKSTDRTQLQDDIKIVSDKATANADAIEKLNGDEHTEGSVKQSINNAFNEFAANLTNNDVIDTYKELIDYAAKHAPEFDDLVAEVGGIDSRVGGIDSRVGIIEADLPDYKETVTSRFDGINQAIEGYINDTQEALDGKADLEHEHSDLYYDKDEIAELVTVDDIDSICGQDSGDDIDAVNYATEQWVRGNYQPKGDYATENFVLDKIAEVEFSGSNAFDGAIIGLSVSGKTITYTKGDGSTGTITTQDTNTTYSLSSFGVTATDDELNVLDGITATTTELNYVGGVTSNIQTQLNGKAASSHGVHVPSCTTSNNGQFLRVVNGVATWSAVQNAEEVSV